MAYEKIPHTFLTGEVLTNSNGNTYRVISIISSEEVLFQNTFSGEYVKAWKPSMYIETYGDSTREVLIWNEGVYYNSMPNLKE